VEDTGRRNPPEESVGFCAVQRHPTTDSVQSHEIKETLLKISNFEGPRWRPSLILALLMVSMAACGGEREAVQAQTSPADTLLGMMLQSAKEEQSAPRPTSPRIDPDPQQVRVSEMGYNLGSPDAPLKVLEFSDFGCGYCRRFHEESFPTIKRIYIDGGFVEWKFIPFVIGMFPNGLEASLASECAGEQDQFFPMQKRLFESQRGWRSSEDPNAFFAQLAEEEGLDVDRFTGCLAGNWRENRVRANIRLGQQAGVQGTPLFIIDGGPLPGALPLDSFRLILDAALTRRGITPPGG
jgi:protein-disulfide isomerase